MPDAPHARLARLFGNPETERAVLEGSHLYGATYREWLEQRSFIPQFLHKPGTLLDIGCANGLLLLCLTIWSPHEITPFGIDNDPEAVRAARNLLPEHATNFALLPHGQLQELPAQGLPAEYDFVYWNVWDDVDFEQGWQHRYADQAITVVAPGGRLGLGFYDREADRIERKVNWLRARFGEPQGRAASPSGGQVLVWWQR